MSDVHEQPEPDDILPGDCDIVVVGGGIIGAGVAWQLARAGRAVTLIDAPRTNQGMATWAAAGMLAPIAEADTVHSKPFLELALQSQQRWPAFAAELEADSRMLVGYEPLGSLLVALDTDELAALQHRHDRLTRLGLAAGMIGPTECRRREPMLASGIVGGLFCADDAQVDNRAVLRALQTACRARGASLLNATVDRLERGGGAWRVHTGDRSVCAESVVIAGGAWSGSLAEGLNPVRIPIRPVRGQMMSLAWDASAGRTIGSTIRGERVYIAPKQGRIVLGATSEERGFQQSLTAGGLFQLLEGAWETCPGLMELDVIETWTGFRPASRDSEPILGMAADGLFVATGHYRNGIQLAPSSIDRVVACVIEQRNDPAEAFQPQRFFRRP
jgi:glycine oxidase